MNLRRCQTCGAAVEGRSICPRCGTLVALESSAAAIQLKVKTFINSQFAILPRTLLPHYFLWLCAVTPLLVLPAMMSLLVAIRSLRRTNGGAEANGLEWLAVISAINVVLSSLVIYKLHFSIVDFLSHLGSDLRAMFNYHFLLPPGQEHSIRPTPI